MALLSCLLSQGVAAADAHPRVIVLGVNGMEWDLIRPLITRGELPNMAHVIERGVYGKLKTLDAPNCPKVYSAIATSAPPEENGITGFKVNGVTANTSMLKREPLAALLSKHGVTVGLANVPATFPAFPVNGYVVAGMLTTGKGCEDGILCSPRLSQVQGGAAVYPTALTAELQKNVGDFWIDCSRMPSADELRGREAQVIDQWLAQVSEVRAQQTKLFNYLLKNHPTDFTMLVQSCEDRVGHWLYPIQPHNVGYDPKLHAVRVQAFPDQYRALDRVLGEILKFVDERTYLVILSDHGIKPLREFEDVGRFHYAMHDHGGDTPMIANHDFADGDDVPGALIVMGPDVRHGVRLMGFEASVYDIAPTILKLYGISAPATMHGRVLTELFSPAVPTIKSATLDPPAAAHHAGMHQ
jgi:predicted AlkP superfamily phosphohydrolase/phosphomutase